MELSRHNQQLKEMDLGDSPLSIPIIKTEVIDKRITKALKLETRVRKTDNAINIAGKKSSKLGLEYRKRDTNDSTEYFMIDDEYIILKIYS
jgi:hypothetical protein